MRDLNQHPITTQEIIECLRQFKADCDPHLIGDMRPLLLERAIEAVRAALAGKGGDMRLADDRSNETPKGARK